MCCTISTVTGAAVTDFLCLFRDDGLSSSQAHIALNDHASLFHETKEQLDGITLNQYLVFSWTAMIWSLCKPLPSACVQTMTATRTATCRWRMTRAAPTPPHTHLTARTRRVHSPQRIAGKAWRLMWPRDHNPTVRLWTQTHFVPLTKCIS